MSLKFGKADVAAMAAALDPEYAAIVEATKAAQKQIKGADDEFDPEIMDLGVLVDKNTALIEDIEDFAANALAAAEEIFEKRAKFVVVGQLQSNRERTNIPASDPEAIKLSLGWYSTEGDARKAADSLWFSTASGDTFRTWVLNVHHGTAADLHAKRKAQYAELEAKQAEAKRDRLKADIARIERDNDLRNKGLIGGCKTAGCNHQAWQHGVDGSSRGKCWETGCNCPKWREK